MNDTDEYQGSCFGHPKTPGFFLVKLRGSEEGEGMLQLAKTAFDVSEKIHSLEVEKLKEYAFKPPLNLFGYCLLSLSASIVITYFPSLRLGGYSNH